MNAELVAIGSSEFLLGFSLAGVSHTELANAHNVIEKIHAYPNAGIIIVDDALLGNLTPVAREELETNISPVIIAIAKDGQSQLNRLRKSIKSTLGVDVRT